MKFIRSKIDYKNNKIKAHEKIYDHRMKERADQMDNINTQIGPIYVAYPSEKNISDFLLSITKNAPSYDFESFDNSIHKLWCINDDESIKNFQNLTRVISHLYIADGHHRMGAMQYIKDINPFNDKYSND